ncbi:MAG: glutathione S-transferase [Rhizorhabdus sp.]|uniref:glutathione S-transferase n=1 Tax=Rhizorhabdus sp. TaxID=1968843 RepID=UPI001B499D20|nr:glutathione S-transferase [Rhizorhabdus sp.]MBP8233690.1 glutathione S-transferase [Rhizorhabdus sp.]
MTALPILYSFRRCPYAMRARMALFASGQRCEIREVKLSAKPPELAAASPKATVPVLCLPDGRVIDESVDIMRWALDQADPEAWVDRDDPALTAANDGEFKHHLDRYKYPERHGSDAAMHRAEGLRLLGRLERRLVDQPWLCGDRRGLADIALFAFVRQFAEVDRVWFDAQPLPEVQRWLAGLIGSDLFAGIMVRLAPWKAGDVPILFPA